MNFDNNSRIIYVPSSGGGIDDSMDEAIINLANPFPQESPSVGGGIDDPLDEAIISLANPFPQESPKVFITIENNIKETYDDPFASLFD